MDIDDAATLAVHHGRQLVHPGAVIMIVVGVLLRLAPAVPGERRLNVAKRGAGHEYVEVADPPSSRGWQACVQVGRALHQHDGYSEWSERVRRAVDFP